MASTLGDQISRCHGLFRSFGKMQNAIAQCAINNKLFHIYSHLNMINFTIDISSSLLHLYKRSKLDLHMYTYTVCTYWHNEGVWSGLTGQLAFGSPD